ncbi:hypothetical protein GCM10010112_25050 [Actinoplanes lobatus]|uniref:Uncharacterized protein n=2 Tax=Actinoplanes lobatus TaxID=113568 RepID=A0ABQ4AY51_9ACTN|nr:hypothetical protein GCM10010112_25050 [Actinoplanes lobatus]GIE45947.1 hypothetical protein Alo02nite_88450 [Actinoplanes lobatus]
MVLAAWERSHSPIPMEVFMRNAIILLAGGILLTATACGTAADTAAPAGSAAVVAPGVATGCQALAKAYGANMAPFAKALTETVSDPKAASKAQQALASFATAVDDATKGSEDAQLRTDGKKAAEQLRTKSGDAKFFQAIKTPEDVNKTMGQNLTEWLSPVQRHCQ